MSTEPMEREELERQLAAKQRQLDAMRDMALALGSTLELESLLSIVMQHVTRLMDAARSTLYLLDESRREMWAMVAQGAELLEFRLAVGQGLAGWVAAEGQLLNVADAYQDPRFHPDVDQLSGFRTQAVLAAPVRNSRGALMGVVQVLNKRTGGAFDRADELLLDALSFPIAVALENARLFAESTLAHTELRHAHVALEQRVRELDLLLDVEKAMSQALTTDELLTTVLGRCLTIVGAEAGSVVLAAGEATSAAPNPAGELFFSIALGGHSEALKTVRLQRGQGVVGWVIEQNRPTLVADARQDPRHLRALAQDVGFQPTTLLCVPMPGANGALGAIELLDKRGRPFDDGDLRLMTLVAAQLAQGLRATREREERERQARLAAIGQMLAGVVHDFKTPMTAIQGYVELMTMTETSAERQQYAETVYVQVQRLMGMTRDLLQFARGQTEVLLHKVNLDAFAAELEAALKPQFEGTTSRLQLRNEATGTAFVDDGKLLRALQNMGRNALEALAAQGGGCFSVTLRDSGDDVELCCSDDGPGIAEALLPRLFQSFATHGKAEGTGLGLAIVKSIVEQHRGTIQCETGPGKGTTFRIRLPREAREARV